MSILKWTRFGYKWFNNKKRCYKVKYDFKRYGIILLGYKENEIMSKAIKKYGIRYQYIQTIEECAELSQALTHFIRGKGSKEKIIDEIADVQLMARQLARIFGQAEVDKVINKKIRRLEKRLKDPFRKVIG